MKKLFCLFFVLVSVLFVSCTYTEKVKFEASYKYQEYHNSYDTYTWTDVKDSKGNVVSRKKKRHHHYARTLYYVCGIGTYEVVEYVKQEDGSKVRNIIETKRLEEKQSVSKNEYDSYFCREEPLHEVRHHSGGYGY